MLVLVTGCYDPISNAAFVEDQRFTEALPTEALLGPPGPFADLQQASDPVLDAAIDARDDYLQTVRTLLESGEALRRTSPDNRGSDYRSWQPLPVASTSDAGLDSWWIRADVVDAGDGLMASTIEVAESQDGPWTPAGEGWRDPMGRGGIDWDLTFFEDSGHLNVAFEQADYGRNVTVEHRGNLVTLGNAWGLYGDAAMGLPLGDVLLTTDGAAWPASAGVLHSAQGGRADGTVFTPEGERIFHACWDAVGETTYLGGDPGVQTEGNEALCVGEPLFSRE